MRSFFWAVALALVLLGALPPNAESCQSCLLPTVVHPHRHQKRATMSPPFLGVTLGSCSGLALSRKIPQLGLAKSVLVAFGWTLAAKTGRDWIRRLEEESEAKAKAGETETNDQDTNATEDKPVTDAMVSAIGVYKNFISPLLPPACRFVPTCSQYGVQAIEEFGPTKGAVLTAWRILRCSPLGGKGYDPPKWPPVSYTYSSY